MDMPEDDDIREQVTRHLEQQKLAEQFRIETFEYIERIKHEVAVRGANDSEILELNRIIEDFKSGKIGAEQAKTQAYNIQHNKQDYH